MTASKRDGILAAWKLYEETKAPAWKLYDETVAPARKLYERRRGPREEALR